MQCHRTCNNCGVLEKKKDHYRNIWLGAKHKLQLLRTELNSKIYAAKQSNFYFCILEIRYLEKMCRPNSGH